MDKYRLSRLACAASRCLCDRCFIKSFPHYLAYLGLDCAPAVGREGADHRSEFTPGHIRIERDRVFLEDAPLALKQPLDIDAVLLDEAPDLMVL